MHVPAKRLLSLASEGASSHLTGHGEHSFFEWEPLGGSQLCEPHISMTESGPDN